MAPKPKKTKEEKAAEKAKKEEEARLAEEERLRQEEEARKIAEQHEQSRQQLVQEFKAAENARVQQERQELVPFLQQLQHDRAVASQEQAADTDWQRYLSCNPLPDPRNRPDMNDFFNSLAESSDSQLEHALKECEGCVNLAEDCLRLAAKETMAAAATAAVASLAAGVPVAAGDRYNADTAADVDLLVSKAAEAVAAADAKAAQYRADAQQLYAHVGRRMDDATARVLQYADKHADDKGNVLLTAQQGPVQWGLWVNTHKNPRFKLIDFSGLGMTIEIPKQLALANIALRSQRRPQADLRQRQRRPASGSNHSNGTTGDTADMQQATDSSCWVPLGGILQVDLLSLPPAAKQSKGWTIRQVTAQSSSVAVVPYPIPPAGADLSTWQPDEEPPPLTFHITLPRNLLVPANVHVGWWDDKRSSWSQDGISNASYDAQSGRLSFSSIHLGYLALLQDTTAALPYNSWTIRPTGGLDGTKATVNIRVESLSTAADDDANNPQGTEIVLDVGRGTLTLVGPPLPQLAQLLGRPMPPWQLMSACEECGLRLTPGGAEAKVAGLQEKDQVMEGAMCADLALLCGNFLVASSRWNRAAGSAAVLCRLSEVTDWEEGGRTGVEDTARIFKREVQEGDRRVLVVRRQGLEGVMFVEGSDSRAEAPALSNFSSKEGVQAAASDVYCHLHADLLHLLTGPPAEVAEMTRAQSLAATPDGLDRVRATDSVFTLTMQQTLQALRLFTVA